MVRGSFRGRRAPATRLAFGALLAAAIPSLGCAGAQSDITAKESRFPISLSGVLVDPDGKPVYLGHELEEVGVLHDEATKLGFLYATTGINHDLSDVVNEQVEAAGGEGVVNLAVTSQQCALNFIWPMTMLPIWPGCLSNTVTGVIVRRKGAVRPTVEPPPRVPPDGAPADASFSGAR